MISTGPAGGNGPVDAFFEDASADGSRVFFETGEVLTADDTDGQRDVYERASGVTTRVSIGPDGGNDNGVADGASFAGASADGSRAFVATSEILTADDTDSQVDIYQRAGGLTTRITAGDTPGGGNGMFDAFFRGVSSDGTRLFFITNEQLTFEDLDSGQDVYERASGVTTLVSIGNSDAAAQFRGASADGSRVFYETSEGLSGDTDDEPDIYERAGAVTTRISIGNAAGSGNGDFAAFFQDASADGLRVLFETDEALTVDDTDTQSDLYERAGATTTRISTGPAGGNNGSFPGAFLEASTDGARIFFDTVEALTADDTDGEEDIYERAGGMTTRISTGPSGGNGAFGTDVDGVSADGARVFFNTEEPLTADDTDVRADIYERSFALPPVQPVDPPVQPAKALRTVELDASKSKVKKGKKVKLSGEIASTAPSCESAQQLTVERKLKGKAFKALATATTNAAGKFSLKSKVKRSADYRALVAETADCEDDVSNTEKVKAKKKKKKPERR